MPRAARRKGRRGDAAGEQPQADATQAECAVHAALRAALRGAGADAGDMRLGLATEFVLEALSGPGLQTEGEDVRSLEELLGSAMESVEVCAGADERAAAAQSLLDSGALRSELRRLRLEAEAAAEDERAAAELFSVRAGVTGLARLSLDDCWHDVCVADVLDGKLVVELLAGQVGAGGRFEVDVADFRAEWEVEQADDDVAACELCEREMPLTFHHLIPKEEAARYRDKVPKEELARGSHVCRPCHSAIHRTYTNAQLAASYRTIERLLDESDETTLPLRRWVQYAARQRVSRTAAQQRLSARRGGAGLKYGHGA